MSGQVKAATVELKYTACKCDVLELQLQASMLLVAAMALKTLVENGNTVDSITVYTQGYT